MKACAVPVVVLQCKARAYYPDLKIFLSAGHLVFVEVVIIGGMQGIKQIEEY